MPVKRPLIPREPGTGSKAHYDTAQKYDAVAKYLMLGNMNEVSRLTKIPPFTLRRWKEEDWWEDAVREVRQSANLEQSGKLGKLVNKAINVVEDRLEHGDYHFNKKSGKIERVPIKSSIAHQVSKDMIDRKLILDRLASKGAVTEEAIEQRLRSLQDEFLKFARNRVVEVSQSEASFAKSKLIIGEKSNELLPETVSNVPTQIDYSYTSTSNNPGSDSSSSTGE